MTVVFRRTGHVKAAALVLAVLATLAGATLQSSAAEGREGIPHSTAKGASVPQRRPAPRVSSNASGAMGPSGAPAPGPGHVVEDRYPRAAASYLVDLDGIVIWGRALDTPRAPASLTKIMTAVVLLDERFAPDAVVVASARGLKVTGSRLGLRPGESMTAGQLLDGMLIASANDAAAVLAEHAGGGSLPAFVERMNQEAGRLGLLHTHFANPTGLDAKGQVSTARDLRVLTETALARPDFTRRIAMREATVTTSSGRTIAFASTNELLGRIAGVRGVKTGTTARAGECIIALAERDGHRVLVVLMGAKDRWWTAAALIEAAFREAGPGHAAAGHAVPAGEPPSDRR